MKLADLTILNMASFLKSQFYLQPVMLLFYLQNGLDVADFFFFQGVVCFSELFLGLPCGWLADKLQKKYILILAYSMLLLRYSLWLFFRGYWIILIGELCYACYKSLFQSSAEGYIYQYLCDRRIETGNLHNYGKFNFAMSFGSAVAALLGAFIFKEIGITVLLIVQNSIIALSLIMLFFISPVSQAKESDKQSKKMFSYRVLVQKLKSSDLKYYILLSAMLTALTNLFVNTFQPLMIFGAVPVVLYGFVYFFNHITRALAGFGASKIIEYLGINRLAICVLGVFGLSFAAIYILLHMHVSYSIILALLFFICLGIALQLCLSVGVTSYLQEHTEIDNRSMMASVHNTSIRLFSSLILFANTALVKQVGLMYETMLGAVAVVLTAFLLLRLNRARQN